MLEILRHNFNLTLVSKTVLRFLPSVLACTLACVLSLRYFELFEKNTQYIQIAVISYVWLIALKLWFESKTIKTLYYYLTSLIVVIGLTAYYHYWPLTYFFPLTFSLFLSGLFIILINPYSLVSRDYDNAWAFQFKVVIAFAKGVFIAGTFAFCLNLLLFALELLFKVKFYTWQYLDVLIFSITFIAPFTFLHNLPKDFGDTLYLMKDSFLRNILKYLLLPFLSIYALILHAYATMIILQGTLPKGLVGYLVFVFTSLLLGAYIILQRWRDESYFKLVYKYSVYTLIVPLTLLFVALHERIESYGLTEMRYIMFMLALCITISAFFMLLRLKNPSPVILSVFGIAFFAISIIPLSPQKQAIRAQLARMQDALTHKEYTKASRILDFFSTRSQLPLINKEFNLNLDANSLSVENISKKIGFEYTHSYAHPNQTIYFQHTRKLSNQPLNGYSVMIPCLNLRLNTDYTITVPKHGNMRIVVATNGDIKLFKGNSQTPFYTESLGNRIIALQTSKNFESSFPLLLSPKTSPSLMLFILDISGSLQKNQPTLSNISFILFVK